MSFRKTIALFVFSLLLPLQAMAQQAGMIVIRDTEIEQTVRGWATPIWRAAGLNPDAVRLILVQSQDLNAFVAGGSNIFVYSGLIAAAKSPGELLGVIAHETGHIAGGHLIRGREAMERASYEAILATILGAGAAVAGSSEAANALIIGGRGAAISGLLAHSRVQESSADQAALSYMEAAAYNPSGLEKFLGTMKNQELLPESQQNPYMRTHPLTSERLDAMARGVEKSKYATKPYPTSWDDDFARIKAKLVAFTQPQMIAWIYSEKDTSVPALYARAIAAYRRSEKDKALGLINDLLGREPKNPWFHEVKGQMLRDFGQLGPATESYRKAVALAPDAALIRIDLAQVLIEMPGDGQQGRFKEAEENLNLALSREPKSTQAHRLLATLYGRSGDEAQARYHLAEEAALRGRTDEARRLLEGAMPGLAAGSRAARLANDLKVYLDAQPKKDDRNKR